jgi:hypothetical protein
MKLFKTENNCLCCSNAIFKNWGHIRTHECKYNIIHDLWYCYRYRNPELKIKGDINASFEKYI